MNTPAVQINVRQDTIHRNNSSYLGIDYAQSQYVPRVTIQIFILPFSFYAAQVCINIPEYWNYGSEHRDRPEMTLRYEKYRGC